MPSIQLFNNPFAKDTSWNSLSLRVFLIIFSGKFKNMSGQFCFPDLPSDRHNSISTTGNLSFVICMGFACQLTYTRITVTPLQRQEIPVSNTAFETSLDDL